MDSGHPKRLVRFIVLGFSNALIGYGAFALLLNSQLFPSDLRVALSQGLSYSLGIAWAFIWSRVWVFREPRAQRAVVAMQGTRFASVQISLLLLSVLLVSALVDGLGWSSLPAWIAAMTPVTIMNYLAAALWVFPAHPSQNTRRENRI